MGVLGVLLVVVDEVVLHLLVSRGGAAAVVELLLVAIGVSVHHLVSLATILHRLVHARWRHVLVEIVVHQLWSVHYLE